MSGTDETPGKTSYRKYHILQGLCLGNSLGCPLGLETAEVWERRLVTGTEGANQRAGGR